MENDEIRYGAAAEYIRRLTGDENTPATFQVFDDTPAKDNRKARIYHGPLKQHFERLAVHNNDGCGIFCTVNETDLNGRGMANMTGVRAILADDDDGLNRVDGFPLRPHMAVLSSRSNGVEKKHFYWCCENGKLGEYDGVINRLMRDYGTCAGAKGLNRVLRLPGFFHKKDPANPQMVEIIHMTDAPPYPWPAIVKAFPPIGNGHFKANRLQAAFENDPVLTHLRAGGFVKEERPDGKIHIVCPFEESHTEPSSVSSTSYFVAHTGGYMNGHFKCQHAHCAKRTREDFLTAIGYATREPGDEPAERQSCGITMLDLCEKEFPSVLWLLPGMFPSGSLYLAGPPKLGKSVFITNLAVAVATDGVVYGDHLCGTGDAIYLAMEDNERRLKNRIIANLGQRKPTDRLKLITMQDRWPVLGEGCLMRLRREIDSRPNTCLVIIDTLKRIRPKTNGTKKQQYDADYDDLTRIHALTVEYPMVLFVIIGHTRKMGAEDIYDTISGTQGLSGAVDTLAVFAGMRGVGKAKLYVDGRDVMGVKKSVVYDKPTWSWNITGDFTEVETTEYQDRIFTAMVEFNDKDGLSIKEISMHSGITNKTIEYNISKWMKNGIAKKVSRGRYQLCDGALKAGSMTNLILSNLEDPTQDRY